MQVIELCCSLNRVSTMLQTGTNSRQHPQRKTAGSGELDRQHRQQPCSIQRHPVLGVHEPGQRLCCHVVGRGKGCYQ